MSTISYWNELVIFFRKVFRKPGLREERQFRDRSQSFSPKILSFFGVSWRRKNRITCERPNGFCWTRLLDVTKVGTTVHTSYNLMKRILAKFWIVFNWKLSSWTKLILYVIFLTWSNAPLTTIGLYRGYRTECLNIYICWQKLDNFHGSGKPHKGMTARVNRPKITPFDSVWVAFWQLMEWPWNVI